MNDEWSHRVRQIQTILSDSYEQKWSVENCVRTKTEEVSFN